MEYHQRGELRDRSPCNAYSQILSRHENFTPPALGGHDRSNYYKVRTTPEMGF